jgi:RNA polymerase sigma-70 factor (ECF subfamily)
MGTHGATLLAIEVVYRSRGGDFFRVVLAREGDPELARDAVQEGFARAIRARRSFRGDGTVDAWIARCVLNAARDIRRRTALVEAVDAEVDRTGDIEDIDGVIREAMRRVPQRQRDVLFLRFYLDLDYGSIADALGIAVGTVSATLHAARKALAHALEEVAT